MRATITNYIDAMNKRREEEGEEGFSLIELIVVVVVIGILIAVAFPIFGAVQQNAAIGSLEAAAAEGATVVASEVALGHDLAAVNAALAATQKAADYTLALDGGLPASINDVCVIATATAGGALNAGVGAAATETDAGPGC